MLRTTLEFLDKLNFSSSFLPASPLSSVMRQIANQIPPLAHRQSLWCQFQFYRLNISTAMSIHKSGKTVFLPSRCSHLSPVKHDNNLWRLCASIYIEWHVIACQNRFLFKYITPLYTHRKWCQFKNWFSMILDERRATQNDEENDRHTIWIIWCCIEKSSPSVQITSSRLINNELI
jgi:hypothetical protein